MLQAFWESHQRWLKWIPWTALVLLFGAGLLGDSGLLRLHQLKEEHSRLESSIHEQEEINWKLKRDVRALKHNPRQLERLAREELGLVKPGEVVYQFPEPEESPDPEPHNEEPSP